MLKKLQMRKNKKAVLPQPQSYYNINSSVATATNTFAAVA